jgi:O-antigen/teichoic acid export membrane protein
MNPKNRLLMLISFVREIVARGLRSRLLKASGIVLTANMTSGAMNFVAIIIMMRHLNPEAFGILAFALTTMQLTNMFANLGLNETLMTMVSRADAAHRPQEVAQTLTTILRIRLTVTGAVASGAFLLAEPIAAGVFGQPHLAFPLFLGVLGGCGAALCQFSLIGVLAFRQYKRHAAIVLSRFSFVLLAIALLVALKKLDLTAAIIINISAPFLAFGVSLFFVSVPVFSGGGKPFEFFHRVWNLSKWVAVTNICSMFFGRLQIYLLTAHASGADLGIYSAAFKLCGGIFLLETAVRLVLFPEISRRSGYNTLRPFVLRCFGGLVLLVGVVYALGLLASPLIPILLGESYRGSVPIFLIILAAHSLLIPMIPMRLLLFATDRTQIGAMLAALQLAVLLASGLLLIPVYGASGAAWTQVIVSLVAIVLLSIFAWPRTSKEEAGLAIARQLENR